mmetsp:Transcript_8570/g.21242  ORF Transcript_8570/g.21242 Transcript_8570/m.21242 type:complete len:105 (-) Transcript_8570:971-1285(-)|eukprot:CAMPEP_0197491928 /NCGR_PEP_ID=MMETSP1311-20131121/6021_1 /TAXON_ID=464262 /ORGANISM="Genus nov. species nov., Strain RCC856" /LENGTH=104 /DNA_ID=CAMNT_0043036645 /DNA_START=87 /DNA_END=401 /DNA_ORIENTATION=-
MKVCAAKSVSRVAVKAPARRANRLTVMSSASKQNKKNQANKAAVAATLTTLTAAAPAFAANVSEVGQVAGAEFLPSVLVPLVGLVFPAVAMAAAFIYLETEQIS